MITKKARRHSGWTTPHSTIHNKKNVIINECLDPQPFYDGWNSCRDGYRDYMMDRTKKKKASFIKVWDSFDSTYWNGFKKNWKQDRWKLLKQKKIRQARKSKHLYK